MAIIRFQKEEKRKLSYSAGTKIDFVQARKEDRKYVGDVKVIRCKL